MNENLENNELENLKDSIQAEIDTMEKRYDDLKNDIEMLEKSKSSIKDSIKTIHEGFEQINNNIEEIMARLDTLSAEKSEDTTLKAKGMKKTLSMRKLISNPLRRLAVGVVGSVYAITDRTIETASGLREGFEDIVAEAQYENRKRRMESVQES